MSTVTVEEIRSDLDKYLRRVASGETLVLTGEDGPIAEVRPVAPQSASTDAKSRRPFGLCAGDFVVPEDFDDPLPEEVLRLFEGD